MASSGESEEDRKIRLDDFRALCHAIGAAFFMWQDVEKAHFNLFLRMLGSPQWEVCAAAYYSIESFAARHTMVGRMAHYFMQEDRFKKHREQWSGLGGGLAKELKDANDNRNKLAHYNLNWDVIKVTENPEDGSVVVEFGPPSLQPLDKDLVSKLIGRTPDKPEHNLTRVQVVEYSQQFVDLGKRLEDFQESLNLPPPQRGLAELLAPQLPTDPLYKRPPLPPKSPPADKPPSAS
jgi:hypothetical protein